MNTLYYNGGGARGGGGGGGLEKGYSDFLCHVLFIGPNIHFVSKNG